MIKKKLTIVATSLLLLFFAQRSFADQPEKWFYAYVDLERDPDSGGDAANYGVTDFIETILPSLEKSNYSAVVLSNYYLGSKSRLENLKSQLAKNLQSIVAAAVQHKIEIIPEVMSVGASASILLNDPNLAEGTPARDVEFIVKRNDNGLFAEIKNKQNLIPHGDLNAELSVLQEELGIEHSDSIKISQLKTASCESVDRSLLFEKVENDEVGYFAITKPNIPLKKQHQYKFSFQMKTKNLIPHDPSSFYALIQAKFGSSIRRLERVSHEVKENQDWKTYVVSFNSFISDNVELVFAFDEIETGKIWIDNLVIQEVGGVNLLRRDDLPVIISNKKSGLTYMEGTDYEKWNDPEMGLDGFYEHDEDPPLIEIPDGSRIAEGETLLVSYYHALLPNAAGERVCCSMNHPDVLKLMRMQINRLNAIMADQKPKRWLINHDEIRAVGREPVGDTNLDGKLPARLLGKMLEQCVKIIGEESPQSTIVLMNDMYDPFHNAVSKDDKQSFYPMVNGSFEGSWTHIPKNKGVSIWNWSLGDADLETGLGSVRSSFGFFDDLGGFDQIVGGFYDVVEDKNVTEQEQFVKDRARRHFQAAKQNGKVTAVCYYTTQKGHRFIAKFAEAADSVWP